MGSGPLLYYLTRPCQLAGAEIEGGVPTLVVDSSTSIPVVVLGQSPAVGDVLPAYAVGGRWVAERGGTGVALVGCCCQWWCSSSYPLQGASPQTMGLVDSVFGAQSMYRAACVGTCANGGGSGCLWTANKLINYTGCKNPGAPGPGGGCPSVNGIVVPGNMTASYDEGDTLLIYDGKGATQTVTITGTPYYLSSQSGPGTNYNLTILPVSAQYPAITGYVYDSTAISLTPVDPSTMGSNIFLAGDQTATWGNYQTTLFILGTGNQVAVIAMSGPGTYSSTTNLTTLPLASAPGFSVAGFFDTQPGPFSTVPYATNFNWDCFQISWWLGCWSIQTYWMAIGCEDGTRPTGGTFVVSFAGVAADPLPYSASASDVQSAISGLPGAGSVTVTGNGVFNVDPWIVTFTGAVNGSLQATVLSGDPLTCAASGPCLVNNPSYANAPIAQVPLSAQYYYALWMNFNVAYPSYHPPGTPPPVAASYCPSMGDIDSVQKITLVTGPLVLNVTSQGQSGIYNTGPIDENATASDVQAAFGGPDYVTVTGNDGGPWTATFVGNLGGQPIFLSSLSGSMTLDVVTRGVAWTGGTQSPNFNAVAGQFGVNPLGIATCPTTPGTPWSQTFSQSFTPSGPAGWTPYYDLYGGDGSNPVAVTWAASQGPLDPNCGQCDTLVCNPCNVYVQQDLKIAWVKDSGNGSGTLTYGPQTEGFPVSGLPWNTACSGAAGELVFGYGCAAGGNLLNVFYFTAGSCPSGTAVAASNHTIAPNALTLGESQCQPLAQTFNLTSTSCPALWALGYRSFTVSDPAQTTGPMMWAVFQVTGCSQTIWPDITVVVDGAGSGNPDPVTGQVTIIWPGLPGIYNVSLTGQSDRFVPFSQNMLIGCGFLYYLGQVPAEGYTCFIGCGLPVSNTLMDNNGGTWTNYGLQCCIESGGYYPCSYWVLPFPPGPQEGFNQAAIDTSGTMYVAFFEGPYGYPASVTCPPSFEITYDFTIYQSPGNFGPIPMILME